MLFVRSMQGRQQEKQRHQSLSSQLGHFRGSTSEGLLQSSRIGGVRLYGFGVCETGEGGLEFGGIAGDESKIEPGVGELLDYRLANEARGTDDSNLLEGRHCLVAIEQVGRGRLENVQVKKRRGSEMWGALHTYVWASGAGLRHVTDGHPRGSPASVSAGLSFATVLRRWIAIINPRRGLAICALLDMRHHW